jgi:hypothetical protein
MTFPSAGIGEDAVEPFGYDERCSHELKCVAPHPSSPSSNEASLVNEPQDRGRDGIQRNVRIVPVWPMA